MKAVIMAGGRGTRIASMRSDVPKPMIDICGKPVLQYIIESLRNQDITDIVLAIGYMGDVIRHFFGDGSGFGVNIEYIVEDEPLGTAGALYYLKGKVDEDFFLLNADAIMDVDFGRFMRYHKAKGKMATILTHPNSHPYDSGIILVDDDGMVVGWLHKEDEREFYRNRVNAGVHILSPLILDMVRKPVKMDLDREILQKLIPQGQLCVYESSEYIKDMGTPERYYKVTDDIENGIVSARNLSNKQKAVFLDRDGTLNVYKGFIKKAEELELIPGISETIKKINESGYLAIVVTNQPVIARGECSFDELKRINNKLETLLGMEGAYIDDLLFCPHHPDKGFEGERAEYKIECSCRKPKPGLLLRAADKYNIDLSQSVMVGDDERDMQAGMAAGCRCVLTQRNKAVRFEDICIID